VPSRNFLGGNAQYRDIPKNTIIYDNSWACRAVYTYQPAGWYVQ